MFGADFVHRDKSFCICELGIGDSPEEKVNCQRWSWFDKEDWKIRPSCAFRRNKSLSPREGEAIPDVPPEQRQVADLVKRIRKLRWLGMEQEAAKLQQALARVSPERAFVLTPPRDTD